MIAQIVCPPIGQEVKIITVPSPVVLAMTVMDLQNLVVIQTLMLDMATLRTTEDLKIVINKVGKCTQELYQKDGKTTRLSIPRITILRETMFK